MVYAKSVFSFTYNYMLTLFIYMRVYIRTLVDTCDALLNISLYVAFKNVGRDHIQIK